MIRTLLIGFTLLLAGSLAAQDSRPASDGMEKVVQEELPNLGWRVSAQRVETPPVIDGVMDEEVWKNAPKITNFKQVEPIQESEPSEKTEVRFLYTEKFLYLGIRCYDSDPEGIIARQMLRDGNLSSDDNIRIIVDTYHDRRNGFVFELNPNGARGDGLLENSSNFNRDWDGIWYGLASIDDKGWVAEIELPTNTLNFDPDGSIWGFNIQRFIRRKNEVIRWATPRQDVGFFNVGSAGIITELKGLEQGLGLDVKPSLSLRYRREEVGNHDIFNWEPSIDIFYKITPDLTAAFTANTDFADTEVDERQVNLTRFPLFFPEKRAFFLQDAGIFRFGGIRSDPLPFFSRRIGISGSGQPVDILAGVKLTGRVDDLNIGLLDVQTGPADGNDTKNLAVARLKYNVLEESSVGIIATAGNPNSDDYNFLGGIDFNFRTSKLFGDKVLTGSAYIQKSFSEGRTGQDLAWGGRLRYPNDFILWSAGFSEVGENYNPALGFTRRRGIREYFGNFRLRTRPETYIRTIEHNVRWFLVTTLDNQLQSGSLTINPIEIGTNDDDEIEFRIRLNREFLDDTFEISDGVIIPAGTYSFVRYGVRLSTSPARELSLRLDGEMGEFYEGTRRDIDLTLEWRPSKNFFASLTYENNDIDLDFGSFQTHIARVRLNVLFTPDISWNTFVQYDNVSKLMGINSRFRWIIEPGRQFVVVVNQGFLVDNNRFESQVSELTFKISWTFRF